MADHDLNGSAHPEASETDLSVRALLSRLDAPAPDRRFVRGLRERLVHAHATA